ncbi:TetR/AcrR family transcriptional regulator [Dyella japonica]|uniref:TetR/AcrR family transcriptional regulator n=1 Tax=Dyella japonica TaxID=231455 RepID=UPI00030976A8|nr:TetR/AcrR family transcriptional regulator [Dyella japonica]
MDQRIERSRAALRTAVVQLLLQQPYDVITVDDITRHAGVARSTFYVHFEDKDELLRAGLAGPLDLLSQLVADPLPENVIVAALEQMLHVREAGVGILQGSAREVIAKALAGHLETRLGARGLHRPGRLRLPFPVLSHMLADALLAGILEWLLAERPMPASDLARVLMQRARAIVDASRTA